MRLDPKSSKAGDGSNGGVGGFVKGISDMCVVDFFQEVVGGGACGVKSLPPPEGADWRDPIAVVGP